MKREKIKSILNELEKQIEHIAEPSAISIINTLFQLVEFLVEENEKQAKEIQSLKDEINRLKGEKGKPTIRNQSHNKDNSNHSSENERKLRQPKKARKSGGTKKCSLTVDRKVDLELDPTTLPPGAHKNGIVSTIIQDVNFGTDNIEFKRSSYYHKQTRQHFIAPLPSGYDTEYGPHVKALVKAAYSGWGMTIENIASMLSCTGIQISNATVSRMILKNNELFHKEKKDIVKAGILSTPYQHLDDTSGREKGQNCYVHILANPYYTAYFTTKNKDRLSVVDMLSIDGLSFKLNKSSISLMEYMRLPVRYLKVIEQYVVAELLTRANIDSLLTKLFPNPNKHNKHRKIILEACAITSYQSNHYAIKQLIVDDAPQFKSITKWLGLCWIHEGRHYKKMNPILNKHIVLLKNFREEFWDYYKNLLEYKEAQSEKKSIKLSKQFDKIFSTSTGYEKLDRQISLTLSKKDELLLVLKFPYIPLHNNPAELGARVQARNRDIHLHTMSKAGTMTKDTLATLSETSTKLAVNLYEYLLDRITKKYQILSLAELIKHRSVMLC